ncbi:MAG: LL-diaminopimelate aminotransferase [Armatimonadota bacterium]|nr:LL-diaminopimelate aminotransferase [Armatimonadota bacterium]MDW8025479.1 LL-diaminopimelate aminotransferase [Armatimonadota bacterium]
MRFSRRLDMIGVYLFSALGQKVRELRAKGLDVISLGIGDPDNPTPDHIVLEMIRALIDPNDKDRHRYGSDWPSDVFPRAVAHYYRQRFGVDLDPQNEVLTLIGSKEGIAHIAFAFIDDGDVALVPAPGYPVYSTAAIMAGGEPYFMPLRPENSWLPNLEIIPEDVLKRAKLLWLNYPNNPTAAVAPLEFFERAVNFAMEHDLLLCHDAAYVDITYDGYIAPSVLQVPGAKECAVEFFSLSKPYNMTGWRIAAAVGNPQAIRALRTIKDNIDSGVMRPIQFAAAKALTSSQDCVREIVKIYQRRRDLVISAFRELGWDIEPPKGSLYVWARIPDGYGTSMEFASMLLYEAHVAVTPGCGYGEYGEGYFRISLTYPDELIEEAMRRIVRAIKRKSKKNKR